MKLTAMLSALLLCSATHTATAQQAAPAGFAKFAVDLCMYDKTTDLAGDLAASKQKVAATGLSTMVETDDMGMYGVSGEQFIMVSKSIDSLICIIELSAAKGGDHAFFEELEALFDAAYDTRYPGHKESINDDPSPHVDGHDWIIRTAANDDAIITISFGTEEGISISGVLAKKYD